MFKKTQVKKFFKLARERQEIYLKKEYSRPKPWTTDKIFLKYRFCNVFREQDKTTVWFRNNIRERLRNDPAVLISTVAFRWFNLIETGKILMKERTGLFEGKFNPLVTENMIFAANPNGPWINGAYMIKSPAGKNKVQGLCWCIAQVEKVANDLIQLIIGGKLTLEETHKLFMEFPYLGHFMSYEIVTDLRHTFLLENASDIMTWANPGPGAQRGFSRLMGNGPQLVNKKEIPLVIEGMRELLEYSKQEEYWPQHLIWPQWEMRDVEHQKCEYDKYERARLGEGKPKQLYRG